MQCLLYVPGALEVPLGAQAERDKGPVIRVTHAKRFVHTRPKRITMCQVKY